LVEGSNPSGPITQTTENQAVIETGELDDTSENRNFVSGLFFESEIDADLRLIIERWEGLPIELRKAIVKMVK
jgi:hypothetical protein